MAPAPRFKEGGIMKQEKHDFGQGPVPAHRHPNGNHPLDSAKNVFVVLADDETFTELAERGERSPIEQMFAALAGYPNMQTCKIATIEEIAGGQDAIVRTYDLRRLLLSVPDDVWEKARVETPQRLSFELEEFIFSK
jgi:hypothetical protein